MEKIHFVTKEYVGTRIDRWIKKNIFKVPQSLIEKNLRAKKITINRAKVKSSYKLRFEDKIFIKDFNPKVINKEKKFKYTAKKKEIARSSNLIIENNEDFIVVNKPPGLAVQAGTKSPRNLIDIISKNDLFLRNKLYIVHRIDKETSGILLIAKNRKYAQLLTSLFRIRKIHKSYLSISLGELHDNSGRLENILIKKEKDKQVSEKAITDFKVLDKNYNTSLLLLRPLTGRKHQLRKQLSLIGYPVIGDSKYNFSEKNKKKNLMLHSFSIKFFINNKKFEFIADVPDYFKKMLTLKKLNLPKNF